jgi:sugar O-acyltransferase (sialic acid O-acetyltransferase NeuD family)
MKEKILLIGGGLHCKSCIDVIEQEGRFEITGIIDLKERLGSTILGYPVIATDEDIPELAKECPNFFITVGDVNSFALRKKIFVKLKEYGLKPPAIVSPLAYVSKHSVVGEGTILFPFTVIDIETTIGNNCIINHGAILAHEVTVGDNCHISGNCAVGKSTIGHDTFIGANTFVNNGIEIAPYCIIGAGSVVIRSITEPGVYAGNPARKIRDIVHNHTMNQALIL